MKSKEKLEAQNEIIKIQNEIINSQSDLVDKSLKLNKNLIYEIYYTNTLWFLLSLLIISLFTITYVLK